jgi:hypothetical protein
VLAVARDLGVAVFARPFPDALSALILRHGKNAFIGVNSHQAAVRQRFSVAHELGHFVLHHRDHHFIDYGFPAEGEVPGYNWEHERGANQFAAELLMPEDLLKRDARTTSLAGSRAATRSARKQWASGWRTSAFSVRKRPLTLLSLCEQLPVKRTRLPVWLQAQPLVELRAQPLVPFVDGFPQPQCTFGFERQPPEAFVHTVERECTLGELERVTRFAAAEAVTAHLLE